MMFNREVRGKKGFSLIELLVAVTLMLILVGVAAFFLEDYIYKSKVAKATQDLDMFASAINLYDAVESSPFKNYNYFNADLTSIYGLTTWYACAMASSAAVWNTVGGATNDWGDFSSNSLKNLIGTYLKTVPKDPWGNAYFLNTSAGVISSFASDGKIGKGGERGVNDYGGNSFGQTASGRERDIVRYYLGEPIMLVGVKAVDANDNGFMDPGEYIDFTFNKDVQNGIQITDFSVASSQSGSFTQISGATAPDTDNMCGVIPVRLLNNARVLRYIVSAQFANSTIAGKWFKAFIANTTDKLSVSIFDTDQYCSQAGKVTPASTVSGCDSFGRPLSESNNPPRELLISTY